MRVRSGATRLLGSARPTVSARSVRGACLRSAGIKADQVGASSHRPARAADLASRETWIVPRDSTTKGAASIPLAGGSATVRGDPASKAIQSERDGEMIGATRPSANAGRALPAHSYNSALIPDQPV